MKITMRYTEAAIGILHKHNAIKAIDHKRIIDQATLKRLFSAGALIRFPEGKGIFRVEAGINSVETEADKGFVEYLGNEEERLQKREDRAEAHQTR